MYGCESWTINWAPKNWCFWTIVLKNTLESPLDCKEIKLVNPKGNKSWIFIGRTDTKAEAPILWPPGAKSHLIGKDPGAGQEEKGTAEDEMVEWHHWLNRHEFEQALGVSDGQGSLSCCSPCNHKESDTTERLNWTELSYHHKERDYHQGHWGHSPPWVWCYSPQTRMHCFVCSSIIHVLKHTYDEQWAGLSGVLTNVAHTAKNH